MLWKVIFIIKRLSEYNAKANVTLHLLQSEVKTKVLRHALTPECWIEWWHRSVLAYRSWIFYWYQCQKRSACDLATPGLAPSGLLRTTSVWGAEDSWTLVAGTGPGAHFGHCCGWSFGRRDDCPGYRWRGTPAHHRTLHRMSPQDRAESDKRGIPRRRWKGQRRGREGASLLAHSPLGWPHTPRVLPGIWLER